MDGRVRAASGGCSKEMYVREFSLVSEEDGVYVTFKHQMGDWTFQPTQDEIDFEAIFGSSASRFGVVFEFSPSGFHYPLVAAYIKPESPLNDLYTDLGVYKIKLLRMAGVNITPHGIEYLGE